MMSVNQELSDSRIVIFTRYPVDGKAKTRLIPYLGADGAANLHRKMTEYAVRQALGTGAPVEVRYTGGTDELMAKWLGNDLTYAEQGDGDLGERMARAFQEHFATGTHRVVLIGCDCPDNRTSNLLHAFNVLNETACVLGPAADGGYYLIGMNTFNPDIFIGIDWGTPSVLNQTIQKIEQYSLLPVLNDVDEPDNIPLKLSVIIPALNEETTIQALVHQVNDEFNIETIVVDGGSSDLTRELASEEGAIVIESEAGRARQMNAGAQVASGDVLFFLHADSFLPYGWESHVRRLMRAPNVVLGFFRFAINDPFPGRQWVEWGTNIRSVVFKRPYGDQGFFLRRNDFLSMGGYPDIPILEDVMLVKKAKKKGSIQCTGVSLSTSGRRWQKLGFIKTTLINQAILLAAKCGYDLEKLSDTYRNGKKTGWSSGK